MQDVSALGNLTEGQYVRDAMRFLNLPIESKGPISLSVAVAIPVPAPVSFLDL